MGEKKVAEGQWRRLNTARQLFHCSTILAGGWNGIDDDLLSSLSQYHAMRRENWFGRDPKEQEEAGGQWRRFTRRGSISAISHLFCSAIWGPNAISYRRFDDSMGCALSDGLEGIQKSKKRPADNGGVSSNERSSLPSPNSFAAQDGHCQRLHVVSLTIPFAPARNTNWIPRNLPETARTDQGTAAPFKRENEPPRPVPNSYTAQDGR